MFVDVSYRFKYVVHVVDFKSVNTCRNVGKEEGAVLARNCGGFAAIEQNSGL